MENNLIIIPDVHGRGFWRNAVEKHPDGRFIFLGDYLDPYGREGVTTEEAFQGQNLIFCEIPHRMGPPD